MISSFVKDFQNIILDNYTKPALVYCNDLETVNITYQELSSRIDSFSAFLQQQGLKEGGIVSAFLPNSVETFVCFLSAIKSSYSYAPYSCNATKREILNWLDLVKPTICLTSSLISEEVREAIKESGIKTIFIEKEYDFTNAQPLEISNSTNPKLYLATSGTTGEPKAMVIDVNKLWSSAKAFTNYHRMPKSTLRFWNYLPMSYLGGLFNLGLLPLSLGASIVIDETYSGKTVLSFWQTVDRLDINALWFSPSIAQSLLSMAERTSQNLSEKYGKKINIAFVGMAPIKLETKKRFKEVFGIELLENFALSETTFFSSESVNDSNTKKEMGVGKVLPYVELKFSEQKELKVKTPFIFDGYLQQDGIIKRDLDSEGFFSTKDTGYLAEDGTLIIEGRTRDIIKKGGYFIALREIEILAEQHSDVQEAAAVRIDHEFYSESFDLYLVLRTGVSELTDINQFLHKNLVKYKWPNQVFAVSGFPKTAGGKIQKHLLGQK